MDFILKKERKTKEWSTYYWKAAIGFIDSIQMNKEEIWVRLLKYIPITSQVEKNKLVDVKIN